MRGEMCTLAKIWGFQCRSQSHSSALKPKFISGYIATYVSHSIIFFQNQLKRPKARSWYGIRIKNKMTAILADNTQKNKISMQTWYNNRSLCKFEFYFKDRRPCPHKNLFIFSGAAPGPSRQFSPTKYTYKKEKCMSQKKNQDLHPSVSWVIQRHTSSLEQG